MAKFDLMLVVPIGAVIALLFAWFSARKVLSHSEGTEKMASIAKAIRDGASAY